MPLLGMALPFKLTKSILSKMPAILNLRRIRGGEADGTFVRRIAYLSEKKKKSQSDVDNMLSFPYI